jgi:hypothetical protein
MGVFISNPWFPFWDIQLLKSEGRASTGSAFGPEAPNRRASHARQKIGGERSLGLFLCPFQFQQMASPFSIHNLVFPLFGYSFFEQSETTNCN